MKKVLFVIRELSGGGAERALSNIIMNFPEDWEIDLLMNNRDFIDFPCSAHILSLDIPEPKNRSAISHQLWVIIKRTTYLRKIKKENNYDACISFLDSSNISNILSGNSYCKTIISIRSMITNTTEPLLKICTDIIMRLLYGRADKIITVSREIANSICLKYHLSPQQVMPIVNGYNCDEIDRESEKMLTEEEDNLFQHHKVILNVGRLTNAKGQWHLIRAFREVTKVVPEARLCILGDGELQDYLEHLIESCNLREKVILKGFAKNPFSYIRKAYCFVLPSIYEGFPNALAEAVCCNAPCIATDFHSGAREILAPDMDVLGNRTETVLETEYGILTPVCSGNRYTDGMQLEEQEKELAKAMILILQDNTKREYYKQQSENHKKDLDIHTVIEEWIKAIEE